MDLVQNSSIRRVAFLSAEATPYAKIGGLGDVAGALPAALGSLGVEVLLVLPRYASVDRKRFGLRLLRDDLAIWVGGRKVTFRLLEAEPPGPGVRVCLVDHPEFFWTDDPYLETPTADNLPDVAKRFLFFCYAALESLQALALPIDVLHCHDHQTAMVFAARRFNYHSDPAVGNAAGVFTLHNVGYQGIYGAEALDYVGVDRGWFYPTSPFEYYGNVNLMKIGIVLADKVNTVSETYAREVCERPALGSGLDGVLRDRGNDFVGILNGIDTTEWNPADDPLIPAHYCANKLDGKRLNKAHLLETMGLNPDQFHKVPLVGMVTRLVDQKGLDILAEGLDQCMALGVGLVVLGSGLPKYHEWLEKAVERYPDRMGVSLKFDNRLAHLIEAGADIFLMPSLYEPCGLNQLYSLRYGTVPVVRKTGGLADTVRDDDTAGNGNGFLFEPYTAQAMTDALARAVKAYHDQNRWVRLIQTGMGEDYSWEASAKRYVDLYTDAVSRRESTR